MSSSKTRALKLMYEPRNKMGNVLNVKMLLNANIVVFCKSDAQRLNAMKTYKFYLTGPMSVSYLVKLKEPNESYTSPEIMESAVMKNLKSPRLKL